jgi:cell wall-associated NlpC family hydrolase
MQPGDLLFWGLGGSEHVAIYVGAGRILEAGGTRDDVHIGPIWGQPVGAARVV